MIEGKIEKSDALNVRQPQEMKPRWGFFHRAVGFLVAIVLCLFMGLGWVVWNRVYEEQFPYLLELQHSKSRYMEARMRGFLRNRAGAELVRIDAIGVSPEVLFLLRWPVGDEVFVGTGDVNVVYGRHDQDTLWFRTLDDLSSFWTAEDGFSYAITTGGINLGSSRPERMSAKSGMKRREIDEFFRSGVAAGTRIYKDPVFGDRVVSHHEVADTNVVLFSENEIQSLVDERSRSLRQLLWGLALAAVVTIAIGLYFIRISVKPLRMVLHEANEVAFGNFNSQTKLEFRDEVHALSRVLLVIKQRLRNLIEAQKLDRAQREMCHDFLRDIGKARNQDAVIACLATALSRHPNPRFHVLDVSIYFLDSVQENSSVPFLKRKIALAGKPLIESGSETSHEIEGAFLSHEPDLRLGRVVTLSSDELLTPLSARSQVLACLQLRGPNIGTISPLDSRWLAFLCRVAALSLRNLPDNREQ